MDISVQLQGLVALVVAVGVLLALDQALSQAKEKQERQQTVLSKEREP